MNRDIFEEELKELDKNMQYNGVTGEASNSVSYNNGLAQNLQA